MTETRIVKTYRGKGAGRMTVWSVREYQTIGATEVYETAGVWATEAEARCAAECGQASCRTDPCVVLR